MSSIQVDCHEYQMMYNGNILYEWSITKKKINNMKIALYYTLCEMCEHDLK